MPNYLQVAFSLIETKYGKLDIADIKENIRCQYSKYSLVYQFFLGQFAPSSMSLVNNDLIVFDWESESPSLERLFKVINELKGRIHLVFYCEGDPIEDELSEYDYWGHFYIEENQLLVRYSIPEVKAKFGLASSCPSVLFEQLTKLLAI